jgi:hypothetical protein
MKIWGLSELLRISQYLELIDFELIKMGAYTDAKIAHLRSFEFVDSFLRMIMSGLLTITMFTVFCSAIALRPVNKMADRNTRCSFHSSLSCCQQVGGLLNKTFFAAGHNGRKDLLCPDYTKLEPSVNSANLRTNIAICARP